MYIYTSRDMQQVVVVLSNRQLLQTCVTYQWVMSRINESCHVFNRQLLQTCIYSSFPKRWDPKGSFVSKSKSSILITGLGMNSDAVSCSDLQSPCRVVICSLLPDMSEMGTRLQITTQHRIRIRFGSSKVSLHKVRLRREISSFKKRRWPHRTPFWIWRTVSGLMSVNGL